MASPTVQPLTTTFTPAASCLQDIYQWRTTTTGELAGEVLKYFSLGPSPPGNCMPKGWAVTSQFYSPGICPAGYTVACSSLVAVGTVTETRATCCPSLYQCQTDSDWPWYSTNRCTVTASMLPSLRATITSIDTIASTTGTYIKSLDGYDGINANAISIRFQSTVLPLNTGTITPTTIPTVSNSNSSLGLLSTSRPTSSSNIPSSVSALSDSSILSSSSTTNLGSISTLSSSSSSSLTLNSTSLITSQTPISLSTLNRKSSSTSSTFPSKSDPTSSSSIPASTLSTTAGRGLPSSAKAGMGVGLGVGGLLMLAMVLLIYRRRKNNVKKLPKRSFKYWYGTGPARLGVPVEMGVSRSRQWHELGNDRPPIELQGDWGHPSRSWI